MTVVSVFLFPFPTRSTPLTPPPPLRHEDSVTPSTSRSSWYSLPVRPGTTRASTCLRRLQGQEDLDTIPAPSPSSTIRSTTLTILLFIWSDSPLSCKGRLTRRSPVLLVECEGNVVPSSGRSDPVSPALLSPSFPYLSVPQDRQGGPILTK